MLCLPVYLVADVGGDSGPQTVDFVQKMMESFFRDIASDPFLDGRLFLAVFEFADEVAVLAPLGHTSDVASIPTLLAGGQTRYATMFRRLKEYIDADIPRLQEQNLTVKRPQVLLFTSGHPEDTDWRTEHRLLVDEQNHFHPHLWVFGPPGSRTDVLLEVAGKKLAFSWGNAKPRELSYELRSLFADALGLVAHIRASDAVTIQLSSVNRIEDHA